jgi:hypothetical protein
VIRTGGDDLLLLDTRGSVTIRFDILQDGIPPAEVKQYVHETTAGPIWVSYSHWYFFDSGGRAYFAFRTWWDRRVVFSLQEAKQIPENRALKEAAEAAERLFVLNTLQAGAKVAQAWAAKAPPEYSSHDKGPWDEVKRLLTAVHLAGRIRMKEAAPLLRQLEPIPDFSTYTSASEKIPDEGLFLATSRSDPTRQQVQLALRRLGEKPAGYPVREVMRKGTGDKKEKPYHPVKASMPRADRVRLVNKELTPRDVVDALGEPDYVSRPLPGDGEADWVWEYDIDADKPYTLRIVWAGQSSRSIKRVEPPAWKEGNTRDLND